MKYEKKYKEALERAKEIKEKIMYSHLSTESCKAVSEYIDTIFPELTESEDERIREIIYNCVYECCDTGYLLKDDRNSVVAWLEKQKEQKPATDSKSERVIKAARSVLNNWLDGTDCPDVSGDFAELEYAIREYDGEENQKEQKPIEWSEDFEQNIRILLHDKLVWHSDDGSISTAVFIDDKTLKDIVTGIWFYVGKEAMKNPNMELPKQEWSEEDKEKIVTISEIIEHCTTIPYSGGTLTLNKEYKKELLCFIRTLRPSWKPSKEQQSGSSALKAEGTNE